MMSCLECGVCRREVIAASETLDDLVRRIGTDKLGASLIPIRKMAEGSQARERYILEMELWEAGMSGVPRHPAWKWTTIKTLEPGQAQGSLCCRLAVETLNPIKN